MRAWKKSLIFILIFTLFISVLGLQPVIASQDNKADLILKNGEIYTVDKNQSWAEAIAVKDGEIIYVGSDKGVSSFKGNKTKVIDLSGKMVMPGMTDSHNHAYLKSEELFWVTLTPLKSIEEYQQAIKNFLQEHPGIKQLRGVGYNSSFFPKDKLPKELLDEVVPDIPVVIITNGHHSIWVNSKALELAGIDKNTPDPLGGIIERDPITGEPTGILDEFSAQNLVINALPQPDFTVAEYEESILAFQKMAAERGITSVFVPTHYPTESMLQAFQKLDIEGKLTVRYDVALWANELSGTEQVQTFVEMRDKYQGKNFKVDTIKIFADGSGRFVWDQDTLEKTVAAVDKEGFRVHVHAIGNPSLRPVQKTLDAFEYALNQNGKRDARHSITHVPWVWNEDLLRFKKLDVIAVPQPAWFAGSRGATTEQLHMLNRLKSYFDLGVLVASSSDYPVNDFWPLLGIQVGMTRLDPSEKDLNKVLWPLERASLEQMITSYTINGAYEIFSENTTGSIEVGKKADLVVLEKNLFKIPVTDISNTKILTTFFAGQEVFQYPTLN